MYILLVAYLLGLSSQPLQLIDLPVSGFTLVREVFEGFSAPFSGFLEAESQIFEIFGKFLKIFHHP